MIGSVEIKAFRGIREGQLTELSPLVVLVGPNGSGKSTVIEAILIGASPLTADAIVQVIRRHEAGGSGPRWLLWKGGEGGTTQVMVMADANANRKCQLTLDRARPESETVIYFTIIDNDSAKAQGQVYAQRNKFHSQTAPVFLPLNAVQEVRLVEAYPTAFQRPLYDLYTKAVQNGRRRQTVEIVKEVFPGVTNTEILTEGESPIVHLVFEDYSVPASLAGDGIQSLLRLSLELAASGGGVALLEEPEAHQHPGAIRQSARAILAAVHRDIQIILTTHSLELIDALLAECSDKDLELLGLYGLKLQGGILKSYRLPGPDVAFSRTQIEDDLR